MGRIGKLDKRIQIQDYTVSKNDSGEDVLSWSTLATVWAGVEYKSGNEDFEADQKVATSQVIFTIRYTTIKSNYRILYDADYYDILNIEGDERTRYLKIKAKKRNNG